MITTQNILQPSQSEHEDCKRSPSQGMTQLQLPIVEGVASRLDRILARVQGVKLGSSLFDSKGEAAARRIAERDQGDGRALERRS